MAQQLNALAFLEDPRGGSQTSVTPVSGYLTPSSGSVGMWYADTHADKIPIHVKINYTKFKGILKVVGFFFSPSHFN